MTLTRRNAGFVLYGNANEINRTLSMLLQAYQTAGKGRASVPLAAMVTETRELIERLEQLRAGSGDGKDDAEQTLDNGEQTFVSEEE